MKHYTGVLIKEGVPDLVNAKIIKNHFWNIATIHFKESVLDFVNARMITKIILTICIIFLK